MAKLQEAAAQPAQPPLLDVAGHPEAARSRVADLYLRRFGVELDPETQVVSTIGAKEGLLASDVGAARARATPRWCRRPTYPIHIWGPILAGAAVRYVRIGPDQDFFANLTAAYEQAWPPPHVLVLVVPAQPDRRVRRPRVDGADRRVRA